MDEALALERLRGVLADPRYALAARRTLWDQVWQALSDLAYNLLRYLDAPANAAAGAPNWVWLTVAGIALVVLLAAGLYAGQMVRSGMVRDTRARRAPAARRVRADALWQQAQDLAAAGRFSEAIIPLYLSALYALQEHGALVIQESLTNREHARRIAQALAGSPGQTIHSSVASRAALGDAGTGSLVATFDALVSQYDRLRYGDFPVDGGQFASLRTLAAHVRGTRDQGTKGPVVSGQWLT